jgi:dynein heavy chain
MSVQNNCENREYKFVEGGLKSAKGKIESILDKFHQNGSSFVLYDEAVHHILKISRVLGMERSSAMMVGVGGIGKKSITKVSATVSGCHLVHNVKGQGYSLGAYLEDLRQGFKKSGIREDSVCFMLSDEDICDDLFLDYANQYLVTGRITGIFEKDDLEAILDEMRAIWKETHRGSEDSDESLLDFFWRRVTQRFHFVFCFSPSSGRLMNWMKQFPGLSSCTINWFHPWPFDALETVARNQLSSTMQKSQSYNPSCALPEATSRIHELMQSLSNEYFQECGRHVHVTPKSYLSFIQTIDDLYEIKLKVLENEANSLKQGLKKMALAKNQVDMMKEELHVKQKLLSQSHANIANLIEELNQSKAEANLERKKVQNIVSVVTEKAREIYEVKVEAEKELEAAKPALDAALEALNSITPKDIGSLKSLRKPPDVIKRILDCVLLLRHMPVSKVAWHEIKHTMVIQSSYDESLKMMGEMGFLQNLLNFPKDEINDETVELLQPYFKSSDFNYSSAKKASGNVAGLCNWAESMCKYHQIARYVEPKIVRLNESQEELLAATAKQEISQGELQKVESAMNILQKKYDEASEEMQRIQDDANATSLKMKNALTLIESLGGEEMRWKQLYENSEVNLQNLLGDCLLACTFVSYFAPFDVTSRDKYLKECVTLCDAHGIRSSECFDPVHFLADKSEILGWHGQGLPTDGFSAQNGVIFSTSSRVVYIIDPQGQAIQWLGRKYAESQSVPISSKSFNQVLEGCIVDGRPLIIQNVDENFGSSLDSLLQKDSNETIRLNDKEIDIKAGFKVILSTRLSNPELSPENFAKCTVLNFSVTFDGLEEQFLDFILSKDESTLHRKRNALDEDVRRCQNKMRQLELDLLQRLSSHEGDILEDTRLISVLADAKETSQRVAQQLDNAKETKDSISAKCEMYRPSARIATLLYFGLSDFTSLNNMYSTSLEQFKEWFADSIESAEKSAEIKQRVRNIISELKTTVYKRAQRGMFERDKQTFRFLLASKILEDGNQTLAFDLRRALLSMGKNPVKARRRAKEWLNEDQWRNILHLSQHAKHFFGDLINSFSTQEPKWKSWIRSETPESIPYPGSDGKIPTTQLCVVRALRPKRTKFAINLFVEEILGREFLFSKPADLAKLSYTATSKTPIICIISPGADPTNKIHEVAKKCKTKCHNISMGQGQEIIARQYLNVARERGEWICIQNAHLAESFLQELEEMIHSFESCHGNFKIWITTEPTDAFPMGLLHTGIRVTCEPPSGIRDAMVSLLSSMDPDTLEEVKLPYWKSLLVSLSIMHVLCQERRKFGPAGWIVPYEFSNSDLLASMNVIASHLQDLRGKGKVTIDWESLHFLIGAIQYGGRIIDERDQGMMMAYCRRFVSDGALNGKIILYDGRKVPGVMCCYSFEGMV